MQYLPVHSIATDPHLYGKGHLIATWLKYLTYSKTLILWQCTGHHLSQFCMDLHSTVTKLNANQQNWPNDDWTRSFIPLAAPKFRRDIVRNTSSAHIAVDRKHYLHYKHFSIAETVTRWEMANAPGVNRVTGSVHSGYWCDTPKTTNVLPGVEQAGHHQFCIDLHNSSILVVQLCKTSRELQDIWAKLDNLKMVWWCISQPLMPEGALRAVGASLFHYLH